MYCSLIRITAVVRNFYRIKRTQMDICFRDTVCRNFLASFLLTPVFYGIKMIRQSRIFDQLISRSEYGIANHNLTLASSNESERFKVLKKNQAFFFTIRLGNNMKTALLLKVCSLTITHIKKIDLKRKSRDLYIKRFVGAHITQVSERFMYRDIYILFAI